MSDDVRTWEALPTYGPRLPRRCVGGPFDGKTIDSNASMVIIEGEDWAYHRTRPTDTNWRAEYNPNWFIMNEPEPVPPDHVYEWHEREWVSPEVAMICAAVEEATERVFGQE